jgi:hypothetical protein
MALQILIDAKDGAEPSLIYALHTSTKEQIKALNSTIREFEKKHGYSVTRITVSGKLVTVKKPGEEDIA